MTQRLLLIASVVLILMGCLLVGWVVVSIVGAAPDPHLTATWVGPSASVVTWTQSQRACLYHETVGGTQTFVGCYDGAGRVSISFGKVGPLGGALRPKSGDSYLAQIDGVTWRAPLRGVVRLAAVVR